MQALQVNPTTGFLESNQGSSFTSALKVRFIELAREAAEERQEMPDIPGFCKAVGIAVRTFYTHLEVDEVFKQCWDEIIDRCESTLVSTMFARGKTPGGYMDRITWLRSYRPERWNPESRVNITHDSASTKAVIIEASRAIEADIVPPNR